MSVARFAASKLPLKIPRYIERGPTDILRALASTVKFVPSQPEAAFQDDPYLLPQIPYDRRSFLMAKLSGIKTARFFLNKHPELFFRDDSEPKVESFQPAEVFDLNMEYTLDDIYWCIQNNDAENAAIAYKWMKEKKIPMDEDTLLKLLEFMCFTNEDNPTHSVDLELTKYVIETEEELVKYTWKPNGIATSIFNEIKDSSNPQRAYSAMIAGLSKYNQHESSRKLFEEFTQRYPEKNLNTVAYNAILNSIGKQSSSIIIANEGIKELVDHMSQRLVKPNLHTFNNILNILKEYRSSEDQCKDAVKFLNDMKSLDIHPSLSTFAAVIKILSRYMGGRDNIQLIQDIIEHVEHNYDELQRIKDENDLNFLPVCAYFFTVVLNNVILTKRLHRLFLRNPNLFANNRQRQKFLNLLFKFIVTTDSLDTTMEFYDTYVPLHFNPSSDAYEALTESLDLYQADEAIVKRIGNDLIKFKLAKYIKNDAIYKKNPDYVQSLETLK